jgi:hypothetical protein
MIKFLNVSQYENSLTKMQDNLQIYFFVTCNYSLSTFIKKSLTLITACLNISLFINL